MHFKSLLNDMNIEKNDSIYLAMLFIYCLILSYTILKFYFNIGVSNPDIFLYLYNGLDLAGLGSANINNAYYMYLSPVISILLAIFFKMGFVHKEMIFIITNLFSILMIFGMYVFLKTRFSNFLSWFGAILLTSFFRILVNFCSGTIDLAGVCISIWILNFTIMAVDKNPKYYLLAIPLCAIGIFTKYSVAFIIPLMLLYYLSKHNIVDCVDCLLYDKKSFINKIKSFIKSKECKYLVLSIIIAIILSLIFCGIILHHGNGLHFFTQASDSTGGYAETKYTKDSNFNLNHDTYIHDYDSYLFPSYFKPLGINGALILYSLIIIAGALNTANFFKNRSELIREKQYHNKYFSKILYALIILFSLISIFGFKISHFLANISILIIFTILFSILSKYNIDREKYSITILAIAWFLIYFIFFSFINIKSIRYMLTTFPAFVYFVVWSLNSILIFATKKRKSLTKDNILEGRGGKIAKLLIIIICIVLMVYSLSLVSTFHFKGYDNDMETVCGYLMKFDENYENADIGSSMVFARYARWYLQKDINFFTDDETYQLDASNNTYIILNETVHFNNYTEIFHSGRIHLYQRNSQLTK